MKTRIFTLACMIALSNVLCSPSWAQQQTSIKGLSATGNGESQFYFSLLGQLAMPQGELKEYSNVKGGISFELGKSFRKIPSLSAGLEVSGVFTKANEDSFKGLDVTTKESLVRVLPFVRWTPEKAVNVRPFFDFSTGITSTTTETTSVIIDEPTFWNEVLFGAESEVETTTHMNVTSTNLAVGIGAGVVIKKFLMIGVRYYHTNAMQYVNNDQVYVQNNTIQYETHRIPLDMIVVSVGLSNWGSHK